MWYMKGKQRLENVSMTNIITMKEMGLVTSISDPESVRSISMAWEQSGLHFTDNVLKIIFINGIVCILIQFSLKVIP